MNMNMKEWLVTLRTSIYTSQNAMNPQPRQELEALLDAMLGCKLTSAFSSLASERSVCVSVMMDSFHLLPTQRERGVSSTYKTNTT